MGGERDMHRREGRYIGEKKEEITERGECHRIGEKKRDIEYYKRQRTRKLCTVKNKERQGRKNSFYF
jgi:hypothetical protein